MLPSYLRADFDRYFGAAGTPTGSAAPATAQPPSGDQAPAAATPAASAANVRNAVPPDPPPAAAPANAAAAGGGAPGSPPKPQRLVSASGDGPEPMLSSPQLGSVNLAPESSGSKSPKPPGMPPDSRPAVGAARVALDFTDADGSFMDADGSPPHQADEAAAVAAAAAMAADAMAPADTRNTSGGLAFQSLTAPAEEQRQAATLEQAAAALPGVDLVFEDAAPAADATLRLSTDSGLEHAASQGATPAVGAAAAADATPAAAPPAAAAAAAPVVPMFRSRVGRMRLPLLPPQEAALDESDTDLPSGVEQRKWWYKFPDGIESPPAVRW